MYRVIFLCAFLFTASACAPMHKPIPPGVIPAPRPPSVDDEQYGHTIVSALSEKYELDYNNPRLDEVNEIVERLTKAAGADQDPWQVLVFHAPEIKNAGATRGNHVFVWSGMLDATKDKDELAAILAHEISHVLAGHTDPDPNEELRNMLINLGAQAAGIAVSAVTRSPTFGGSVGDITSAVTGEVGNGLFVYPYSRDLEFEADRIGLLLMADAGYDPRKAIEFWERAKDDPDFSASIEFFSTHPPAAARLKNLQDELPEALARYEGHSLGNVSAAPEATIASDVRDEQRKQTQASSSHAWRVIGARAVLYAEPNRRSQKLGELQHDAVIHPVSRRRGWLEVDAPEHGYLEGQDLEPE